MTTIEVTGLPMHLYPPPPPIEKQFLVVPNNFHVSSILYGARMPRYHVCVLHMHLDKRNAICYNSLIQHDCMLLTFIDNLRMLFVMYPGRNGGYHDKERIAARIAKCSGR